MILPEVRNFCKELEEDLEGFSVLQELRKIHKNSKPARIITYGNLGAFRDIPQGSMVLESHRKLNKFEIVTHSLKLNLISRDLCSLDNTL